MTTFEIILLSVGLAMDCFAVSIASGMACKHIDVRQAAKQPILFGFFQGFMPLIGFLLSVQFAEYFDSFSHWIALAILSFIGGKMILEDIHSDDCGCEAPEKANFCYKRVTLLAIATSIDALATGIIFASEPQIIAKAVLIIGLGSFLFSVLGLYIGNQFGKRFSLKVGILGGVILVGIGVKIVIQHYM